ncbi:MULTISPECIES: hypothetical protein [unclassified Pseudoalteromonas]|uniref:hypothetical protein n=1 Tax=unclassified Pseudoalteromonas TaxID=194690 RepID=UPI0030146E26
MIITLMSFFVLIPVWFAVTALYASSPKQIILQQPLSKSVSYSLTLPLTVLAVVLLSFEFDWVSAVLAILVMTMAFGVAVTLICGYSKKRYTVASSLLITSALLIGGLQHVV